MNIFCYSLGYEFYFLYVCVWMFVWVCLPECPEVNIRCLSIQIPTLFLRQVVHCFDCIFWPGSPWDSTILVLMFVQQTLYTVLVNLWCCVKTPCKRERGFWEKVYSSLQLQTEPQWWETWYQAAGAGSWEATPPPSNRKQSEAIGPQSPLPSHIASSSKALLLKGL